jgi:hypothetical protein
VRVRAGLLLPLIVAAGVAAGLLAGCGTSHPAATAPAGTGNAATGTTGTSPVPSVAPSTTAPYVPPVLPSPPSSGALRLTSIGLVPGGTHGEVVTEAPDGTVFVGAQGGIDVVVVDGLARPVIAEHADAPVEGLAADAGSLYIATTKDLTRYDRTTGAPVRSWPLPLAAQGGGAVLDAAGRVWVLQATGHLVEVDPAATGTTTALTGLATGGFAVDATGAYVVTSGGASLVHVALDGSHTSAPTGQTVNMELSGPDAVHAVAVYNTTLVVAHDAGQGEDSTLLTYSAATLAPLTASPTTIGGSSVVATLAGPLIIGQSGDQFCASNTAGCVARSVIASAQASKVAALPAGQDPAALAGPYPALVTLAEVGGMPVATLYRLQ